MHVFIELLIVAWLVVSRSLIGFVLGVELLFYLKTGALEREQVTGLWLERLALGNGEGELRTHLWWDQAWCTRIVEQHQRRQRLKGAWR